jgi:cytosine/adenosine deaminase-related metal-dependent hydrolase
MQGDLFISSVRLRDEREADVLIRGGVIVSLAAGQAAPEDVVVIGGGGCLALPGLVEAHTHLGYSLLGMSWYRSKVGPTIQDKIDNERREMKRLAVDPRLQTIRQIRHCAAFGSTHLRGHVAVDTEGGIAVMEGVLAGVSECADLMDVQVVAFPQSGLLVRPGTVEMMDAALRLGADIVGGIDPAAIDRDPKGHLDTVFALSQKHGKPVDIHLHETGELGAFSTELIIERTLALGLAGKVMISHAFCLGMPDAAVVARLLQGLAEAGIAVMTTGPAGRPCPVVKDLLAAGVTVCSGSDGIRDTWGPYNSGDMLERAMQVGMRNNLRRDDEIALAVDACTRGAAAALGLENYGLHEGGEGDVVLVQAETLAEAVVTHPARRLVVRAGTVVAVDGNLSV